jgi:hypothetical protein
MSSRRAALRVRGAEVDDRFARASLYTRQEHPYSPAVPASGRPNLRLGQRLLCNLNASSRDNVAARLPTPL